MLIDNKTQIDMYQLVKELFPICRSITGDGFRKSLAILQSYIPQISVKEIASGTKVFDWSIPPEWNIYEAYIEDEQKNRIVDFKENNLHVVGYSEPIDIWLKLSELKQNIYIQEEKSTAIPYVTSYYKKRWGFCMSKEQLDMIENQDTTNEKKYHAVIKSDLKNHGMLTYGEAFFPGKTEQEVLISTYLCHPSMANNECSGPAVSVALAQYVSNMKDRRYGYRFIFIPETIGSIAWLSKNFEKYKLKERMVAGFVLSCIGDDRTYSFVSSKYANTLADKVLRNILKYHYPEYTEYSFLERGSDERQFNSPGIDLPVCSVCRSKYGTYPEYHTSLDNLDLVTPKGLQGGYDVMCKVIRALEYNNYYKVNVLCEPQLGKRGLYPTISQKGQYDEVYKLTNFITYADGTNDLIDISNIIGVPVDEMLDNIEKLIVAELIEKII